MRKLLTLLLLFVSVYCSGQALQITIYNKTRYDVDSVYIGNSYVGSIKKDSSKLVLNCKELIMKEDLPYPDNVRGVIKNKTRKAPQFFADTSHTKKTTSGVYLFDIGIHYNTDGFTLWWRGHNAFAPKDNIQSHYSKSNLP